MSVIGLSPQRFCCVPGLAQAATVACLGARAYTVCSQPDGVRRGIAPGLSGQSRAE
jgi:hypothetical protein